MEQVQGPYYKYGCWVGAGSRYTCIEDITAPIVSLPRHFPCYVPLVPLATIRQRTFLKQRKVILSQSVLRTAVSDETWEPSLAFYVMPDEASRACSPGRSRLLVSAGVKSLSLLAPAACGLHLPTYYTYDLHPLTLDTYLTRTSSDTHIALVGPWLNYCRP
jgi:hypothetical protein